MTHDLNELANLPLSPKGGNTKALCKRIAKIWLPHGRKGQTRDEAKAAKDEFFSRQIDLEDAVEQAGGQRGHMGKAA